VADLDFETQLSRLYGQAPVFRDAELFAQQVADKLDRGWALRRVLIGATGVVAGVAAAAQLVSARFSSEFSQISQDGARKLDLGLNELTHRYDQLFTLGGSETIWLGVALVGLALAFAVTRLMDEV
jgi:di/tricarboxylate transporter